jgi:hypothetical protein
MNEKRIKQREKELKEKAAAWIKEKMPERMEAVGVDEKGVRNQLEHEAERWVRWNLEQFKEGKPGTDSPEAGLGKLHGAEIPQEKPW